MYGLLGRKAKFSQEKEQEGNYVGTERRRKGHPPDCGNHYFRQAGGIPGHIPRRCSVLSGIAGSKPCRVLQQGP